MLPHSRRPPSRLSAPSSCVALPSLTARRLTHTRVRICTPTWASSLATSIARTRIKLPSSPSTPAPMRPSSLLTDAVPDWLPRESGSWTVKGLGNPVARHASPISVISTTRRLDKENETACSHTHRGGGLWPQTAHHLVSYRASHAQNHYESPLLLPLTAFSASPRAVALPRPLVGYPNSGTSLY